MMVIMIFYDYVVLKNGIILEIRAAWHARTRRSISFESCSSRTAGPWR